MLNKKNTFSKAACIMAILFTLYLSACKPSTPPNPNEEEMISSVLIHLVDSSGVEADRTIIYRDLDGDGGNAPQRFDSIRLSKNKTYWSNLYFLDETKMPIDTISKEVNAEADEHLICYTPNGISMPIVVLDQDGNNLPLGLVSKWRTGASGTGALRIQLRHQPGNKNGSCDPGSSDIDLNFTLHIE
ncbi:MAG: hypothetical protein FGM54_07490 [Chitinophagaceae bacterium]|nr:hypothetical protein [Chitinophagaceae bacterium]